MTARTLADGRYALSEPPLGAGGMGTVWKAYDTVLQREVAIKELRIPDGLSPEDGELLRARAMREARAAAGLDHPGIVTIHDVVDEGGRPWIVMRLLSGRSLDKVVRADGPLSPRRAAELGLRLLDALSAAHAKGVLHRDVKPQNVMLDGAGHWMLTDFGIASVAGATRTLTGTGQVTGTLGYIAPERLSGEAFGPAADLWALGATLYFAVEGRHAYDHDDLPALIAAVLTRAPEPPRNAGPLAPVLAGLMERDPARRLDARAAREQLQAVAGGHPTFERPTERLEPPDRPTRKLEPPHGAEPGGRVVRALRTQLLVLNAAVGALLGLVGFSLADGMPIWIAGALALALAIGGGLGAWLATYLGRWLGQAPALIGSALLMGESVAGAGALGTPEAPVPAIVLAGVALVAFAAWHRLAASIRRRVVPAGQLGRTTAAARAAGFAGVLIGGAYTGGFLWLQQRAGLFGGNYVVGILVTVGVLITVASLLAIPAVATGDTEPPKPRARTTIAVAALVIPAILAGQAVARYVERLDDYTAVPDICSTEVVSQERVTDFLADPPERITQDGTDTRHVSCEWRQTSGDVAQLRLDVTRYDNAGNAARELQFERDLADENGEVLVDIDLGDEGIRHWYDGSIDSEDTVGVALEIRIENLVLEVQFDRSAALGSLDEKDAMALAAELVREIESERPSR